MNKIFFHDVEVFARHGVDNIEKQYDQRFLISVIADYDASEAMISDDISDAVNYAALLNVVKSTVMMTSFSLLERLARHLADVIFQEFDKIMALEIIIKKFPIALSEESFVDMGFSSNFVRDI